MDVRRIGHVPEHATIDDGHLRPACASTRGEAEKVHRVALALRAMGDEFARLRLVQAKARLDDALQARAFLVVELAVDGGEMNQQGGGGELIVAA